MPRFLPEPKHDHSTPPAIGILLINLGTPAAATAKAVKPYLKQFLSDPRVVEIPRAAWWLILNGIILNTRPKASAEKYAKVWNTEGSPLRVHTEKQAKLVQGFFSHAGQTQVLVDYAMRYGKPGIDEGLRRLKERGCTRILTLPLYPQYAASTTASTFDAIADSFRRMRNLPELRMVRSFHDDAGYIRALAASVQKHWEVNGRAEKLVMSFHGVPRFTRDKGDPYFFECQETARLLVEQLGLKPEQYVVTFQSRFGKAEWLKPYTQATLEKMAKDGVKTVDVICPGFVADCLETLEEIAIEVRSAFIANGGKALNYIPCLNERHDFINALVNLCSRHMQDWLAQPVPDAAALKAIAARANSLGAKN
ncbi:ferrochelatase [Uliginosibacterium sp. H3]|uniref:Ferrochelatase n=1 Tax=Uliginosibacterium silvisoli TaxID=3114758 RepID=A0ABU6K892_9RHOO|nr:ferrochelatase [Uliginosibacterium sp. H3]